METLRKLNEKIFARTKSAEENFKESKGNDAGGQNGGGNAAPPKPKPEDAPIGVIEYNELREAGISHATIATIAKSAKERKMTVSELWGDPIYKAGILAQERTARGRDGTPPPSGRVGSIPSNDEIEGYGEAKTPAERNSAVLGHAKKVFEKRVQGKGETDGNE